MKQGSRNSLRHMTYRQLIRAKRFVLNRRGDGVHSPYAFRLISKVVRNPYPYGCFATLGARVRQHRAELGRLYGDCCMRQPRVLELVFRLVVDHRPHRVVLFAPRESLLVDYLHATGCIAELLHYTSFDPEQTESIGQAQMVIIEEPPKGALTALGQAMQQQAEPDDPRLWLLYRGNPKLRQELRALSRVVKPDVQFDLLRLELWVWRSTITPGRYKVFY